MLEGKEAGDSAKGGAVNPGVACYSRDYGTSVRVPWDVKRELDSVSKLLYALAKKGIDPCHVDLCNQGRRGEWVPLYEVILAGCREIRRRCKEVTK